MTWWRWLWPFPWPWKPDDIEPPSNPMLLIPGICGTQLGVHDKQHGDPESNFDRVWVCIQHADAEYKKLWGKVNPKTHHLDLLDPNLKVCVPKKGQDGGLFPIDVLDPSLYVPLHVVYYFHNMIWYLKKHKYESGKTLFGMGYDFRQSNKSHLDELVAKLESISHANNGARVDVVTHSMGGLVMRCLLAYRPADYERLVRKWVAIASPFGGAPGFTMDALMTGVQFTEGWQQYFFVNRSTMHTMCSQAPAVFELLPDPVRQDIWPRHPRLPPPTASAVLRGASPDDPPVVQQYSLDRFRDLMAASMKDFTVTTYNNQEVVMEMDPVNWTISDDTRRAWRTCRLPPTCQFFNIFGTGFQTAYSVTYGSEEQPLDSITDIARGEPVRTFTHVGGDSTVPICCAVADGLDASDRAGYFATHRGLLELPQVWERLMEWIERPMGPEPEEQSCPAALLDALPRPGGHAAKRERHLRHRQRLRPEAHERTRDLRKKWEESATRHDCPEADSQGLSVHQVAGGRRSEEGWMLVCKDAEPGDVSDTIVNPLLC